MNRVIETIEKEKIVKKHRRIAIEKLEKKDPKIKDFSNVNLLAGEEHNQELNQLKSQINLIDFNQHKHENSEFIERKIKEIYNNPQNKELVEKGEFPVICFKNIEKIGKNQALEESLLPVFDSQQNDKLFDEEVDLSRFILIATTSTRETEKLSDPLLSRLDWVNADTVSLLINLVLLMLLLVPKFKRAKTGSNKKNKL
ncbi:hypothetical protein [endosymbiont GvMRE of Glomus versiforme]|uniref:hypothetical protein n=1 Tax=endosymbiont GvMRE of Glomus versiforme TaxID=2039283 RepID=UPI000EE9BCF7|nr:hypothetical protein [endosymbiont GvMRE of Glomus versiforme]RHZ36639.1 hypothetical protein GvMRE_I2g435 [endosymbiont GvMRE of Glomus versiforme]